MSADPRMHIAFVCTKNRARSVMAAAMFAQQLADRGLGEERPRVTSSGTHAAIGRSVDALAARVLDRHGYADQSTHRATPVNADVLAADLIVAMTAQNVWDLLGALGAEGSRVRLLRSFDPKSVGNVDVPNPMLDVAEFERVFAIIDAALPGLHGWVDERFEHEDPARSPAITEGWRLWVCNKGEDVLRAPFYYFGALTRWPTKHYVASCEKHPDHKPPDPVHLCGLYADFSAETAWARARWYRDFVRGWQHAGLWEVDAPPVDSQVLVVGRVALDGAVPVRCKGIGHHIAAVEIRAAAADIVELYVVDDVSGPGTAETVEKLEARYSVPVEGASCSARSRT